MTLFCIGLDVSKGYVDVQVLADGQPLEPGISCDDTPRGRAALGEMLSRYDHPTATMAIGVESTGGMERNWLREVKRWATHARGAVSSHLIDPRAVKAAATMAGLRTKTDASSATAIALFLHARHRSLRPYDPAQELPLRGAIRHIGALDRQRAGIINNIKALLIQVHPALVSHTTTDGLAQWVVTLLSKYPTAQRLSQARKSAVAAIPHVTTEKAEALIRKAQQTTNALEGPAAEFQMQMLIERYRQMDHSSEGYWQRISSMVSHDPQWKRMQTIIGIGVKTATAFIAELGDITRFTSADALVASVGLDCRQDHSGDQCSNVGISRQGPAMIRRLLYTAARSAVNHNPHIKAFYQRLKAKGKPYNVIVTACMAKMVRLIYGVVISQTDYDPTFGADRKQNTAPKSPHAETNTHQSHDLEAPVSAAERRRRKARMKQDQIKSDRAPVCEISVSVGKAPAAERSIKPSVKKSTVT